MRRFIKPYHNLKNYFAFSGGTYAGIFILGKRAYLAIFFQQKGKAPIYHEIHLTEFSPHFIASQLSAFLTEHHIQIDAIGVNIHPQYFPIRIPQMPFNEIEEFLSSNPDLFLPPGVSPADYVWRYLPYGKENDELLLTVMVSSLSRIQEFIDAFKSFDLPITLITADLFEWPQDKDAVLRVYNDETIIIQLYKIGIPVFAHHFTPDEMDHPLLSLSMRQFNLETEERTDIQNPYDIAYHLAKLAGPEIQYSLINFMPESEFTYSFSRIKKRQTMRVGLVAGFILLVLLLTGHVTDFVLAQKINKLNGEIDTLSPAIAQIQLQEKRLNRLMRIYDELKKSESKQPALTNLIAVLSNDIPERIQFQHFSLKNSNKKWSVQIEGIAADPGNISEYIQRIETRLQHIPVQLNYTRFLEPSMVFRKWKRKAVGLYQFQLEIKF